MECLLLRNWVVDGSKPCGCVVSGSDRIPEVVLRNCTHELSPVLTPLFELWASPKNMKSWKCTSLYTRKVVVPTQKLSTYRNHRRTLQDWNVYRTAGSFDNLKLIISSAFVRFQTEVKKDIRLQCLCCRIRTGVYLCYLFALQCSHWYRFFNCAHINLN